jgi:hypothetical protein
MRLVAGFSLIVALVFDVLMFNTASAQSADLCTNAPLLIIADGPSDMPSACTVAKGSFLAEGLYYQNASRFGGTALAAYPLMRMRVGVAQRTEFALDAPSEIAESGFAGAGVYTKTEPGYGLDYTFAEPARADFSLRAEEEPPASRFTPSQAQPKTSVDITSGYHLSDRFTVSTLLGESDGYTTSTMQRTERWFPISVFDLAFLADQRTQISTDFGGKTIMRRASAQAFGDISVARLLSRNLALNLGLGTTFNPVAGTKAHYLALGVDCR